MTRDQATPEARVVQRLRTGEVLHGALVGCIPGAPEVADVAWDAEEPGGRPRRDLVLLEDLEREDRA